MDSLVLVAEMVIVTATGTVEGMKQDSLTVAQKVQGAVHRLE